MSKKKHAEEPESSERWLVSYADFITLLMVLFVVLYSMGQVDVKKYKQLADSFKAAFSLGGAAKVVDAGIDQSGGTQDNGQSHPITIPGIPQTSPGSAEVASELTKMLTSSGLANEVSVQSNIEGVLISLSQKLVFAPGTAELQKEAFPVLDTVIKMLKPVANNVRIVGHTDDSASTDSRYPDNWSLSLGRAKTIADYMIAAGIQPARITIAGRGEYDPLFSNDTPEHRAMNSRADIVVIYNVSEDVVGLNTTPTNLNSSK